MNHLLQGEWVALAVAIVTAVTYLIKISLQLNDHFHKIERAILGVKDDLRENYNLLTQEQLSLRQDQFKLRKQVSYITKILAEVRPDAFKRDTDFSD